MSGGRGPQNSAPEPLAGGPGGDLVLVADVHIGAGDPELPEFCAFLRERAADTAELVLLGDIFALWLGAPKYTAPHHRAVLDACRALRAAGVRVVFVEGNREFLVKGWEGDAFDEVVADRAAEPWGGRRWYLAHGDLINTDDAGAAAFRRVVRSRPVAALARALPAAAGLALARRVERGLRHRNLRHKTSIPERRFAHYAGWFAERGFDAGAIGHIHVEMRLDFAGGRALFVLPDWRSTHRYLRIPRQGEPEFRAWGAPRPVAPAIVDVREADGTAELRLDAAAGDAAPGTALAVTSGHGPEARFGTLLSRDAADPRRVVVRLEDGAPLQVGDRVTFARASGASGASPDGRAPAGTPPAGTTPAGMPPAPPPPPGRS